jgi:CheY-like chemotaxis protein/KaiC/GvpD/RAD55 family RecA-like ATPase
MGRIMIVDDDPDILRLVKTGLSKAGFEVTEAQNADVALSKISKRRPDLIITDAMMPEKDGYMLSRELRSKPETGSLPIIMLTALQEEQDALKAFQDGIDDFITKPFSMAILRARVNALLHRAYATGQMRTAPPVKIEEVEKPLFVERISTGFEQLDKALGDGMPAGSNAIIIGPTGAGKSTFARRFIAEGIVNNERCMVITIDDDPAMIRSSLDTMIPGTLESSERKDYFRLVDCYSWSRGRATGNERFMVTGAMELNQLAGLISDAGAELGQTVNDRLGGRRMVDSVSSLFIDFELALVQRFLVQLARTASNYGGVSTLFILEEGSVSDQVINNIKYLMDIVLEVKFDGSHMIRVANMKWSRFSREWISIEE